MIKIAEPGVAADGELLRTYTGHGLSTNVVEASLRAYLAAVNKLIAAHPVAADVTTPPGSHSSTATRRPRSGWPTTVPMWRSWSTTTMPTP